MTNGRIEVITSVERQRRWSAAEKERLVATTLEPGASVTAIAREAGIAPGQLYGWRRRQLRTGASNGFVPVRIAPGGCGGRRSRRRNDRDRLCDRRKDAGHGSDRRRDADGRGGGASWWRAAMIGVPSGGRVWIATGHTDMRRGMNSLALLVQEAFKRDPHGGDLYVFRGRNGKLIKILWHDGLGMSLYAKRLERGRFIWSSSSDGAVVITPAQLGYMLEGIDWRHPLRTWRPSSAG
jgi:transposase